MASTRRRTLTSPLILAVDLGLQIGLAILEPGARPRVAYFRIPHSARDLGLIAIYFEEKMEGIIGRTKPDVIVRATRFINRQSNPLCISPYFGLSMVLDAMAIRRHIKSMEVSEQDARKAFLGNIPRGSKAIKRAIRAACLQMNYPVHDEHSCDAIVVGVHTLSILVPEIAHTMTPLFEGQQEPAKCRRRRAKG